MAQTVHPSTKPEMAQLAHPASGGGDIFMQQDHPTAEAYLSWNFQVSTHYPVSISLTEDKMAEDQKKKGSGVQVMVGIRVPKGENSDTHKS